MHVTCPSCCERFPLAAGLADDDGKRLAALLAGMEPVLGRAVVGYLRLFKPAQQGLRTARAARLVQELVALVDAGSVCKDERGGLRRPATAALWAEGIEQMLATTGRLSLPLANHNYLRAIVYGLADQADAANERQREAQRAVGAHRRNVSGKTVESPLRNQLAWLAQQLSLGQISEDEHDAEAAKARAKHG